MSGLIRHRLPVFLTFLTALLLIPALPVSATEYDDYQRDLDIYRQARERYEVKKEEFIQYGTFQAEEDLIQEAQAMLIARDDVWLTYWHLMSVKLLNQPQLPAAIREVWQQKFTNEVTWLRDHKTRISPAKTRKELLGVAAELNTKADAYGGMAFAAVAETAVDTLLNTTQKLLDFNAALTERVDHQQLSPNEKEVKLRGLSVQSQRLHSIAERLSGIRTELAESSGYASAESFSKISQEVSPLYAEISQQNLITRELAAGVEW